MSDKLTQDFDIYYKELENFTGHFKTGSQRIETDKMLSRSGKFGQVEEIKASHLESVSDLDTRFHNDFGKRLVDINDFVDGKKKDVALDSIKEKFSRGESLSGDETNRLLLHEMMENKDIMRKSNFQNMLANADEKQLRKTAQTLADNKDVEKLGWLQESVSLRGEESLLNSLAGQIDGIKTANLNDEQLNLKGVSEKIEREMKLFEYSIERSKKGDFVDVRNNDEDYS